ncbi:MAG: TylF/MycF/NovP-related O-methyltransferase [Hyphomonadaceae bacterium]
MLVTNFWVKATLYKLVCAWYQLGDVARVHPWRERNLRALQRTTDYVEEHMSDALGMDRQRDLIVYSLAETKIPGHYMEFGVFTGGTIRFMAKLLQRNPAARKAVIHGFDSFEGLPEAWSGFNLGGRAFDVGGKLPSVPSNVKLHKGWFENSIPPWLERNPGPIAFMHIDCDLYSSTKTIFDLLAPRMVPGTIILFDEYFNYPNWERHEFKAFQELVAQRNIKYTYLGYARQQVTVRIDSIGATS